MSEVTVYSYKKSDLMRVVNHEVNKLFKEELRKLVKAEVKEVITENLKSIVHDEISKYILSIEVDSEKDMLKSMFSEFERFLFYKKENGRQVANKSVKGYLQLLIDQTPFTYDEIMGARKDQEIFLCRCDLLRKVRDSFPDLTLVQLGTLFNRDRTTIMNMLKKHSRSRK